MGNTEVIIQYSAKFWRGALKRENHRILGGFRLEGTLKIMSSTCPAMGRTLPTRLSAQSFSTRDGISLTGVRTSIFMDHLCGPAPTTAKTSAVLMSSKC